LKLDELLRAIEGTNGESIGVEQATDTRVENSRTRFSPITDFMALSYHSPLLAHRDRKKGISAPWTVTAVAPTYPNGGCSRTSKQGADTNRAGVPETC
jgi:hypothetical protein